MVIDGYYEITCVGDGTTLVQGAVSIVDRDRVWQSFQFLMTQLWWRYPNPDAPQSSNVSTACVVESVSVVSVNGMITEFPSIFRILCGGIDQRFVNFVLSSMMDPAGKGIRNTANIRV